jgi:hypothetical protein
MNKRLSQPSYKHFIVLAETIEERMNLEQAIAASNSSLACRVVDDRRIIVDRGQELLTIYIQRKTKMHWIVDDDGGGVRYLAGVLRDGAGRYLYASGDVTRLPQIRAYLPLCYHALLLPECDDWQAIEREDIAKRSAIQ